MKSILLLFTALFYSALLSAQNVQLHYDFGKTENGTERNYFVSTFELFRSDSLGQTFFFTDFEYDAKDPQPSHGVSSGYFEISREFFMPWFHKNQALKNLAVHFEYNGGLALSNADSITYGFNLSKVWLAGISYPINIGGITLSSSLLYRYSPSSEDSDLQITFVWFYMFLKNRVTFTGFADFWTADNNTGDKEVIVYAETQLWFNIYKKFDIGSEFKISKNFIPGSDRIEVFPTLGIKYSF